MPKNRRKAGSEGKAERRKAKATPPAPSQEHQATNRRGAKGRHSRDQRINMQTSNGRDEGCETDDDKRVLATFF